MLVGFRKHSDVKYEDFELKMLLGRGTFGKVFLAELKTKKVLNAIKAIRKDVLIETTRNRILSWRKIFC